VTNWFHDLRDRADIPDHVEGETVKPKMGRRFWYERYSASVDELLDVLDITASEQGSSSEAVVLSNYTSNAQARDALRGRMQERLKIAFD
jgi:hypothetical protein